MKKIITLSITLLIAIFISGCVEETVDDRFLKVLETLNSIEYTDEEYANKFDYIVNYELNMLEEFRDADFSDINIRQSYENYVAGLEEIKENINNEIYYLSQVCVLEGQLTCMKEIKYLYDNYNFMNDNKDVIYDISQIDYWEKYLKAMVEIINDIIEKGSIKNYWEGYTWYIIFENNTDYTYSITFEIEHMNKDGVVVEKEYGSAEKVKPNEKYAISIPYAIGLNGNYPKFYTRNFSIDWIGI